MSWGNLMQLSPFDVLTTLQPDSATNNTSIPGGNVDLGALGYTTDGRGFRLCMLPTTGTTLATNKLIQGPTQGSYGHLGTVSAQSIGDTSITYTFAGGAQTVVANFYAGGFIGIVTGTGSVQWLQIAGNGAVTTSTTIVLNLQDPIQIATSAAATAEVYQNAYASPIISPASAPTGKSIGVPMTAVTVSTTLNTYFWAQSKGMGLCLGEGTTAQGLYGVASDATAGAIEITDTTGDPIVAAAVEAGSDGLYTVWDFKLD